MKDCHSDAFVTMFLGFAFAQGLYKPDITPEEVLEAWHLFKVTMGKEDIEPPLKPVKHHPRF